MTAIGLISVGKMGASVGAAAVENGHRVIWSGDGRSEYSHKRAELANIENCGSLSKLMRQADIIISVCPPADAEKIVTDLAEANFDGLVVDCNATAPERNRIVSKLFEHGKFVDGGIIGLPAWTADAGTTLYLSGPRALDVSDLFPCGPLAVSVISGEVGSASALKMAFSAYTKGSVALLAAILAVAESEGVRGELEKKWGEKFTRQTHQQLTANAEKAWRFTGEMLEISSTFESAGMPAGFHLAAADIFDRLSSLKNKPTPNLTDLFKLLNTP